MGNRHDLPHVEYLLTTGEYITFISLRYAKFVHRFSFKTNKMSYPYTGLMTGQLLRSGCEKDSFVLAYVAGRAGH